MTRYKDRYRVESTRLPGWDYRTAGWYFITICTHLKAPYFGQVVDYKMRLSPIGQIACQYVADIPEHAPLTVIDASVIMPNHVHVILGITESPADEVAAVETLQCNVSTRMSAISPKSGSVSVIVRSYKAAVTRWCHRHGYDDFAWQPRFHDHIIRNQDSLERIRAYVQTNPAQWQEDCYFAP
jgi:REP element-mobilizing transposase RayT